VILYRRPYLRIELTLSFYEWYFLELAVAGCSCVCSYCCICRLHLWIVVIVLKNVPWEKKNMEVGDKNA